MEFGGQPVAKNSSPVSIFRNTFANRSFINSYSSVSSPRIGPCRSTKRLVSLSKYIVLEAEKYMAAHGQNVSFPPSVRFLLFPCLVFLGLLLWPTTTTTNFSQPHTLWEIALKIATKDALFGIESKYLCVIKFASIDSIMDNTNNREGLLFCSLKL